MPSRVIDQRDSGDFPKESQDTAAASGPLAGWPLELLCPEVLEFLILQGRWPAQEASRLGVCISLVSDKQ